MNIMAKIILKKGDSLLEILENCSLEPGQEIDLSQNPIHKIPHDELIQAIQIIKNKNISKLILSSCGLHLKPHTELIDLIENLQNSSIQTLDLSTNWLGFKKTTPELIELMEVIKKTKIENINLANNHLGKLPITDLEQILIHINSSELHSLNLSNSQFSEGAYTIAELLFNTLKNKVIVAPEDAPSRIINEHLQQLVQTLETTINQNIPIR